jgi:hypothetical protein
MAVAGALVLLVSGPGLAYTQAPTGTITGFVTDATGAGVSTAHISVTNLQTGHGWVLKTSADGFYTAVALLPGSYRVTVEAAGFKRMDRDATVEAGTATTVDLPLQLGAGTESVTVRGSLPLMHYDHHEIGGVVGREQIDNIPLNGRNFLDLAKVEPGMTSPVRGSGTGNRTFIAMLGSALQTIPRVGNTRVTIDGASINAIGVPGASLQASSEIVQEFQVSTASFDAATSLTTNGAINVVSRSGGNDLHGSGFGFYRDHRLSAYPGLQRDPRNPRPFFEREQIGSAVGGPLRRNRSFFFASYERNDQQGVAAVQPGASELAPLGGIFDTPTVGDLFSARLDARLTARHSLVVRHTRDTSSAFAGLAGTLPSGWTSQTNEAYQSVIGVTSLLPHEIVNELRLSHFHIDSLLVAADARTCAGCFGLGAPRISVSGAGLAFGAAPGLSFIGGRYQLSENLALQRGRHRLAFGFDWEHSTTRSAVPDADRVQITVWSPQRVRQTNQALLPDDRIPLPESFNTVDEVLQLPLRSFDIAVGPGSALERDFQPYRDLDMFRLYAADTWRVRPSLTVNVGIGWSYEPNALNHDLTKPLLLAPLLGDRGLGAPSPRAANFSPTAGVSWAATADARTILRAGIGRYFDPAGSTNSAHLGTERQLLSPLGTGRLTVSGSNIQWDGNPLDFPQPTAFTAAQLLAILPDIRANLAGALNPQNRDYRLRNINRTKEGTNLYDPSYALPSAIHITAGVQHELVRPFVVSADFIWKRFSHTFVNGIDYNRFNSAQGPVIPRCGQAERDDVDALCSNGPIRFDTTGGRARYAGVLLRGDARIGSRARFLASYAFGSYVGSNGTTTGTVEMSTGRASGFSNDNWFENYGPLPTDLRHILNLSGYVELPWRFQAGFNVSATSRPPFTAWLEDVDINGDGTNDDLLPGTRVNQFGRKLDHDDLRKLVDAYNQQLAGSPLCCGQTAPRVTLPASFAFNDTFFTQDVRVTHTLPLNARLRLLLFGEVFNLFNTANLVQYSGNLLEPSTFGQPAGRFTQIFGSGGPRAFQLGLRITF